VNRSSGCSSASRCGPARHTAPGRGATASRNAPPAGITQSGRRACRGTARMNLRASVAPSSPASRMPRASACTSPSPFSQRWGSGTFRSVTEPPAVVTDTSPAPTVSSIAPPAAAPARAARIGSLKSTLVVPLTAGAPSSAAGSKSRRACTPQQPENDSKRSRSPLLVTTGSRSSRTTLAAVK
jgi:hypothetical protein